MNLSIEPTLEECLSALAEEERELKRLSEALEQARVDQDAAVARLDAAIDEFDRCLFESCEYLRLISMLDTAWHTRMFEQGLPYDEETAEQIRGRYRAWKKTATRIAALLTDIESRGHVLSQAARFRSDLQEVCSILQDDRSFFDDPALLARQEEAIEAHHRGETVPFEELGH